MHDVWGDQRVLVTLAPDEALWSGLVRALGASFVLDLSGAPLDGEAGPARAEALAGVTATLGRTLGMPLVAMGETLRSGEHDEPILPDAYSSYGAPGGVIELARAVNALAERTGVEARAWVFTSRDERRGLCVATRPAMAVVLTAVDARYDNDVIEQIALYEGGESPVLRAGFR